jgi:hypothetical protein
MRMITCLLVCSHALLANLASPQHGESNEEYDDSYADRRTWNRQPADDSAVGFGGCHSIW